ncbi:MAG: hypothetical protein MI794_16645 [Pseudomonadales bacterium]|nr:hypothetical protein [Pseudomonadales bacterium]
MRFHRLPVKDPRTVARDIPGICDLLFPQLLPSIITYLNRQSKEIDQCSQVPHSLISKSSTNAAMLFEVAYARAEQVINGASDENWDLYLDTALQRQLKYFDAELPENLTDIDMDVARKTSQNLVISLLEFELNEGFSVKISPQIPGFQWVSRGSGDFSIGTKLIEVKCTSKNFGSADYRQLLIYWLLSFAGSLEGKSAEWERGVLLNPRLNKYVEIEFNELISFAAAGRSKLEILKLFESIVSDYGSKLSIV